MTIESVAGAAAPVPAKVAPSELPDRTRSLDAAEFERLYQQAQREQATVQFGSGVDNQINQSVAGVTRVIDAANNRYLAAVDDSQAALSKVDFADTKSVVGVIETMATAAVSGVTLHVMFKEVSSAKKSAKDLFHNQG
jgi:hypothetical protein